MSFVQEPYRARPGAVPEVTANAASQGAAGEVGAQREGNRSTLGLRRLQPLRGGFPEDARTDPTAPPSPRSEVRLSNRNGPSTTDLGLWATDERSKIGI